MNYRPREGKIYIRFNGESTGYDINRPLASIFNEIMTKKLNFKEVHDEKAYFGLLRRMYLRYEGKNITINNGSQLSMTSCGSLWAGDDLSGFSDGDTFELGILEENGAEIPKAARRGQRHASARQQGQAPVQ